MTTHLPADAYEPPLTTSAVSARVARRAEAPRLHPWSRIWRYLIAVGIGLTVWVLTLEDYIPGDLGPGSGDASDFTGGLLLLDLLAGLVALCLLPARRSRPVLVAAVTAAFTAFSASSVGAAALAGVSMSTWRRWRGVIFVGVVWLSSTLAYELLTRPAVPEVELEPAWIGAATVFSVAAYAVVVATGFYVGARRELLATLRERADNAEREQSYRAEAAREAERTRIAREMHDVLAHRISLVAMHAGALTYRTDLTAAETTRTAGIIADNAQLALTELRQVLGVLRAAEPAHGGAEPPQPTLADLPELLRAAQEAGTPLRLDDPLLPPDVAELSETVSRTAYRIIQEALTNARKHAAGQPVQLRLTRTHDWLNLEVHNPASSPPASGLPGAGVGLTGLAERAALAGGSLAYGSLPGGAFLLRAWLPWR